MRTMELCLVVRMAEGDTWGHATLQATRRDRATGKSDWSEPLVKLSFRRQGLGATDLAAWLGALIATGSSPSP